MKNAPLLVAGIAGASASGKSVFLESMLGYFGSANLQHFDLDGYHLHTREERKRLNEYPDEIRANSFEKIIQDIGALKSGRATEVPRYDHKNGIFLPSVKLTPKQIICVEGLHSCLINDLAGRKIIDVGIFLYPEDELRKNWKVERDVNERGYSYSDAVEQIRMREPFAAKHVLPQVNIADIVVHTYKSEKGYIRHRGLWTSQFYNRCVGDKDVKRLFSKYLTSRKVAFYHREYTEIHSSADILYFLKERFRCLGVRRVHRPGSVIRGRHSYTEVIESLILLFLAIGMGERQR